MFGIFVTLEPMRGGLAPWSMFDAVQHATESAGKGRLKFMGRHMNASLLEHVDLFDAV